MITLLNDFDTGRTTQNILQSVKTDFLVGAHNRTQRHLHQYGAIESFRGILAHVAVTAVVVDTLIEITQKNPSPTNRRFGVTLHQLQLLSVELHLPRFLDETIVRNHITIRVKHQRISLQTIAPCSTNFLIIRLHILRHIVMHHPSHIALVDTHTEGYSSTHNLNIIVEKACLDSIFDRN